MALFIIPIDELLNESDAGRGFYADSSYTRNDQEEVIE